MDNGTAKMDGNRPRIPLKVMSLITPILAPFPFVLSLVLMEDVSPLKPVHVMLGGKILD